LELAGVQISKVQQSSDWGTEVLSADQKEYAATDVLYLHEIREKLNIMLAREGRTEMAQACFDFLHIRTDLDLAGWSEQDIFAHS
jgi:ribonuclease D